MSVLDRLREHLDDVLAAQRLAARRRRREREQAAAVRPFTRAEVQLLAFRPTHEWTGPPVTREWWRASGAAVCDVWAAAVRQERGTAAETARVMNAPGYGAPKRPRPWPVDVHGIWPDRPGA